MKIRKGYWREKETGKIVIVTVYEHHAYYFYEGEAEDLGHPVFEGWQEKFEWVGLPSNLPTRAKMGLNQ